MIEVEVKLPLKDQEEIREKLRGLGFVEAAHYSERDRYFDDGKGSIRGGGKALRVREVCDLLTGDHYSVTTFKGEKLYDVSMTREELETEVSDPAIMSRIYERIGFSPVKPAVYKVRKEYKRGHFTACLDQVEGLGYFLELESVIPEAEDRDRELERIGKLLNNLGYTMEDTIGTSYLSLLQGMTD